MTFGASKRRKSTKLAELPIPALVSAQVAGREKVFRPIFEIVSQPNWKENTDNNEIWYLLQKPLAESID